MKEKILTAFQSLLIPIIKIALRNGITHREFSQLCKTVYVKVAAQDYGVQGRETNTARIALITGINRKDIKQLKDAMLSGSSMNMHHAPDRMSRILTGWHEDPLFIDSQGHPLKLQLEGSTLSFSNLVNKYGGDAAPITLLREFKRSRVIEETDGSCLRVLKRYYIPNPSEQIGLHPNYLDPQALMHAGSILSDHLNTIFHNLYREDTSVPRRFERRATNAHVSKEVIPKYHEFVQLVAQRYLEEIDSWLSAHEVDDADLSNTESVRLGMGTYWIEGKDSASE